jgi:hypothetical protein
MENFVTMKKESEPKFAPGNDEISEQKGDETHGEDTNIDKKTKDKEIITEQSIECQKKSEAVLWINSSSPFILSLFPGLSEDDPDVQNFPPSLGVDDFGNYHQILPRLFLGNLRAAHSFNALSKEMNVSHILQIMPNRTPPFVGKFTYFSVDVFDSETVDIKNATKNFLTTNNFIESGMKEKGTFVHWYFNYILIDF